MNKRGLCLVITGPSSVRKTSIIKKLLGKIPNSARLVTTTTRESRPAEIDGQDYFFVSRQEFLASRERGEFLECEDHYGHLYGSSAVKLELLLKQYSVVFVGGVDPRRAKSIKKALPEVITIFLLPGSLDRLRQRLTSRKNQREDLVASLVLTQLKIEQSGDFDYRIINTNGRTEETVKKIVAIIENLSAINT